MIKVFGFIQSLLETCIYNKVSGSATTFLISICEWHIVDPKWCKISGKHKGLFERSFSKEDLDKAACILGIKIYRDRSRRPMILSKNAHLDMILKEFKIDQQRRSSWLCYKVWVLSKTQDLTTAEERERTKVVPYALDVGSTVCYAVYRTWSVPCHELVKGYNSDPGMDHMTAVELILSI